MKTALLALAIMGSLAAAPLIQPGAIIEEAQQNVLAYNTAILQEQIEIYRIQEGEYPASLNDLVKEGYFHRLPLNPYTRRADFIYNPATGEVLSSR